MRDLELQERVLTHRLRRVAEEAPEDVFLQFGGVEHSFGDFEIATNSAANTLDELGLQKRGRMGIFARNSYGFVLAWLSAAKLGAIYVPINTEYRGDILQYQLNDSRVTHLLVDPEFLPLIVEVVDRLPELKHIVLSAPTEVPTRLYSTCNILTLSDLLTGKPAAPATKVTHADPMAISFTSGTTGLSKGVLATNAHVATYALDWAHLVALAKGESVYTPLPLFHAIAAWMGVGSSILYGNRIAISPRFSVTTYWDELRAANANIAQGIFSMLPILMKQPAREDDSVQPARAYYIGNSNPEFEERFGIEIIEAYGATETGIVAGTPFGKPRKGTSCGRINDHTFDAIVADEDDKPLAFGEGGELLVRPKQPFAMFSGYDNKDESTIESWRNLWFHTGDRCRMDEDGSLYFIDRARDVIRRRGENISSFELERAVNKHPDILECAVVPVQSDLGEFEVKIVVVMLPGKESTPDEFWAFCDEVLPRFWVPSYLEFRESLPKTGTQKVQKFRLKSIGEDCDTYARDWQSGKIVLISARKETAL
ncbi:MAG: AMP-binding protein [Aestuariivita sp.]|nr:AMP-binding protein [Aestuariivita sp.]MCY4203613.1 AMP-binding protein [Aestuariivita sp.]MCY4288949.1 AMP-binding protein [Aestuariivita sp.]MCY4346190.1 AMP-binding protein [Aestuariivita sp.]